jgi:nucleoid-associated protein EbfC
MTNQHPDEPGADAEPPVLGGAEIVGDDEVAGTGFDLGELGGLGSILEQAQQMQEQLAAAQEQVAETLIEGHAGGGVVTVEVTGGFEFRSVSIDAEVVDPGDVEMLEDLVLAALHDAAGKVIALQQGSLNLGTGLPALDGLGELFGGTEPGV